MSNLKVLRQQDQYETRNKDIIQIEFEKELKQKNTEQEDDHFWNGQQIELLHSCISTNSTEYRDQYKQGLVYDEINTQLVHKESMESEKMDTEFKQKKYNMYFRKIQEKTRNDQINDSSGICKKIMKYQRKWNIDDNRLLLELFNKYSMDFEMIKKEYNQAMDQDRTKNQIVTRLRKLKPEIFGKKNVWTKEEDDLLMQCFIKYDGDWRVIQKVMRFRTVKQIKERYSNHLDTDIVRSPWTLKEDIKLINLFMKFGTKWSHFRLQLLGRPENMIKNRFNSFIKKVYDLEKIKQDNSKIFLKENVSQSMINQFYDSKEQSLMIEKMIDNNNNRNNNRNSNDQSIKQQNQTIENIQLNEIFEDCIYSSELSLSKNQSQSIEDMKCNNNYYDNLKQSAKRVNHTESNNSSLSSQQLKKQFSFIKTMTFSQQLDQSLYPFIPTDNSFNGLDFGV